MKRFRLAGLIIGIVGVIGITSASAQTVGSGNSQPLRGVGNYINYPPGTQIYRNGAIQTPDGAVTYPNVAVPRGDGSVTYYYPDGTRINARKGTFQNTSGAYLVPGTVNGGVRNNSNSTRSTGTFFIPGGLGRQPKNHEGVSNFPPRGNGW